MRRNEPDKASRKPLGFASNLAWIRIAIPLVLLASALSVGGCALTSGANNSIPSSALAISTTTLPQGLSNSAYEASLAASGGKQPYTWSLASGTLPKGLALTSSSGAISGTPTQAGASTFTVKVEDSSSPISTATASMMIAVGSTASRVSISLSPTTASVINGAEQQFTATVSGSSNTGVSWSLSGAGCTGTACGSLSNAGNSSVYLAPTAPPSPATVTITATSAADTTKSATATVTVVNQISVAVSPVNPSVGVGASQQFSASVLGTTNTAVTWSLTGAGCSGAACGTLSSNGLFKAPSAVPPSASVKITATSVADSTMAGSTIVTIEGSLNGTPPAAPALPEASVDLTMPMQGTANCPSLTSGSDCIRQVPAGNASSLQAALNASTCGDTVVLQAGSTYSGNFTVPNIGSCSGWVVVESSNVSSLPSGTRVGPSSVSKMASLSTATLGPVLQLPTAGIHNFRFIGLEISCATGVCDAPHDFMGGLVEITGGSPVTVAQTPNNIIIDRCYIHGTPTQNIRRGVGANGTNIGVVDSYVSEIHESGAASGGDSQTIEDWNGAGPLLIQNNYLEAASENILFGGADTTIPGLIPSDITIVGNYFYKDPSWRGKPAPYNWVIKDSLEFKSAQRVLVQGNVFAYCWVAGQAGELIELTPRSQGGDSWATAADLTFTDNLLEHASIGFIIGDSDYVDVPTSQPPQRILVQNNVLTDITPSWSAGTGSAGLGFQIGVIDSGANPNDLTDWHDLTIDHNDLIDTNADIFLNGGQCVGCVVPAGPIQITNNIGSLGVTASGAAGGRALSLFLTQLTWNKNVLSNATGTNYPSGTFLSLLSQIGFTNYSLTSVAGTNYQLLPSSPYVSAGTDGKDIGVWDWSTWNTATANAVSGIFP